MAWDMGIKDDGSDSCAREVAPKSHWPEMRALILVASAAQKDVSSTAGMQETVKTSSLFKARVEEVPKRMRKMEKAIQERDFETFARITTRESNSFHATCLDTDPPIQYMNDVSSAGIKAVRCINQQAGRMVAAYTFDAGPNCVIYYLEQSSGIISETLGNALAGKDGWDMKEGKAAHEGSGLGGDYAHIEDILRHGVSRVIATSVGQGPISVTEHLTDEQDNVI